MNHNVSPLSPRNTRARAGDASGSLDFIARAEAVAEIAERFADAVDREARFPTETFAALRERKLLGMLVPRELGGEGARAADVADVCAILGRACGASAMIFAMHQVKLACLDASPCTQRALATRLLARSRRAAMASRLFDHRSDQRRRRSLERSAGAPLGRPHLAGAQRFRHLLVRPRGRRAGHDRAPPRTAPPNPIRCWSCFGAPTIRSSRRRAGTRSVCAAHLQRLASIVRAEGEADQIPARALRAHPQSDPGALRAPVLERRLVRRRVWRCRSSPRLCAQSRAPLAGACRPAAAHAHPRARLSLETLRAAVQAGLAQFRAPRRGSGRPHRPWRRSSR